jgi:hypothetical protein
LLPSNAEKTADPVVLNMAVSEDKTADILARSCSLDTKKEEDEPFGFSVFRKVTVLYLERNFKVFTKFII